MPDSNSPVSPGARIGVYEILGPLGSGGMGHVYRARDTRLDRDVALKVLPEAFASDPDRVMRFTREAKTLAALNHPHIAQIYDTGRDGATTFIAMELVQGEDLSARIRRSAIPLRDALQIARQIADALAAAHDAGIVHRDLKPANVKIAEDDVVKVLDFGLAKGSGSDVSSAGDSGATMTSPAMTAMGLILGTAAYMSPEQAKGKPVDRRADVWAFGVVLYEMLTGTFLFGREDVTDTLAAVLTHEPDPAKLPPATPQAIKRLIAHCLVKDKRQRLDSMAAARIEIDDVLAGKFDAPVTGGTAGSSSVPWVRAAAFVAAGLVVGAIAASFWPRPAAISPAPSSLVARITAPREVISAFHDGFALSADGSSLAFTARNTSGVRQIWIRRLDADAARAIPGTDGGLYPFWSPDGRSIGFVAGRNLRRVDIDGSRLQTITDAALGDTGSWNEADEIVFSAAVGRVSRIFKMRADGGTPIALEALGDAFNPIWLTGGQRFLYAVDTGDKTEVRVASADGQQSQVIAPLPRATAEFAYGGGILFMNRNDTLVAQRIESATGALVGTAVPIAPLAGNPKDWFAVSSSGDRVLALVRESPGEMGDPGDPNARLIWVNRQGSTTGMLGDTGRYWTLRLSPNGTDALVNPGNDIWLLKPDGRHTRVTSGAQAMAPIWNRDGSEIVLSKSGTLFRRGIDPQSTETVLGDIVGTPTDWSNDGRWLFLESRATPTSTTSDIVTYDFQTKAVRPWLATEFTDRGARLSADGKWVAYNSNSSGRTEVYVRAFEGNGLAIPVSTSGGSHPQWRRDGGELYFLSPGDDVMAATISRSGASITVGQPQRLFRIPLNDITRTSWAPYAASPDGQRFLLNVPDRPTPLWFMQGLRGIVK